VRPDPRLGLLLDQDGAPDDLEGPVVGGVSHLVPGVEVSDLHVDQVTGVRGRLDGEREEERHRCVEGMARGSAPEIQLLLAVSEGYMRGMEEDVEEEPAAVMEDIGARVGAIVEEEALDRAADGAPPGRDRGEGGREEGEGAVLPDQQSSVFVGPAMPLVD